MRADVLLKGLCVGVRKSDKKEGFIVQVIETMASGQAEMTNIWVPTPMMSDAYTVGKNVSVPVSLQADMVFLQKVVVVPQPLSAGGIRK